MLVNASAKASQPWPEPKRRASPERGGRRGVVAAARPGAGAPWVGGGSGAPPVDPRDPAGTLRPRDRCRQEARRVRGAASRRPPTPR